MVTEYAQLAVEALTSDDVLKQIPVVKSAVAGGELLRSVKDHFLLNKLTQFLTSFSEVSDWQRKDMVSRIEADPKYGRRVGLHVIEALDRMDSHRKPQMLAAVFAVYAKEEINVEMLNRLVATIEALPPFAIDFIRTFSNAKPGTEVACLDRGLLHLASNASLATLEPRADGLAFLPNATCNAFVMLQLDVKSKPI